MLSCKVDKNIELRLHSQIYAEQLCSVVRNNLDHLSEYMVWATEDYSVDDAKEFIKANRKEFAETELPRFFIFEKKRLIGLIGCVKSNVSSKSVEIGYWLDKGHTGKGIITKSCRSLFDFIFKDLKFNRVVIRCETENEKVVRFP